MILKENHIFFILRFWRDLTHPIRYDVTGDLHAPQLGTYYLLFDENRIVNQKGATKSFVLDEKGIPVTPTYIDVKEKSHVYFPITIGQYGLAVFHTYLRTRSESDRSRFLRIADWFYDNRIEDDRLGTYWLTDVSLPAYRNPGPWQSAFVQGRGISVLLRGYQLTGNSPYLDVAQGALKPFLHLVSEGGVTSSTEWGPFYEEYTSGVPTLVLNGMIFSLCGVHDFVRVFPENRLSRRIFDDGIQTLKNILPEYDLGYWSRYNLCTADWYPKIDPATVAYHHLHITQLKMLYRLTGEEVFEEYADRFAAQCTFSNIIRTYRMKFQALKEMGRL